MKTFIVDKIAQENFYNSSAFIYTDSGAWRHQLIKDWPDLNQVMNLIEHLNGKVLLGQLVDEKELLLDETSRQFPDVDLIEGTFFMGSKEALHYFKDRFWLIHDQRMKKGEFVGKDQTIMNLFAFQKQTVNESVKLDIWRRKCEKRIDPWFFYQNFLASDTYYPCEDVRETLLSINRNNT